MVEKKRPVAKEKNAKKLGEKELKAKQGGSSGSRDDAWAQ